MPNSWGATQEGHVRNATIFLATMAVLQSSAAVAIGLPPPHVRVVHAVLEDDGDHDGWADTRETVSMRVAVHNLTGVDLTGLVLLVSTDDPAIAAITDHRIVVGDLADRETRLSDEAFEFVVDDVDRTDAAEALSVTFRFRSYADQYDLDAFESGVCPRTTETVSGPDCGVTPELTLDLDLDASGGGTATTFFEGFESGFGQFTTMHLDETLNPPPGDISNHALGVAAADGWRCQDSDPEWERSGSYNNAQGLVCYPSQNGVPDTYYWHVVNERGFSGQQSLHYGVLLDPTLLYSTPRAQLEAIRTTNPINLGWANVCSVSRTTFCSTASDCPAGEGCEPSAPRFTFQHQISLVDGRSMDSGPNISLMMSANRGAVAAQLASPADGSPLSAWVRLEPYVNVYDTQANTNYFNCTFDPADDGNTEEDFFDPTDPLRRFGPSSTCFPHYDFTFQGSTVQLDPTRLGLASDGPGLLGAKGPGTWVEPVFDLSRFRGRRLRLRFVATGLKAGSAPLWHPGFVNNTTANPDPRDDGWFIDDARVTDVLTAPASLVPDAKDNSALPGLDDPDADAATLDNCPLDYNPDQADADGDGVGDACDDCPLDPYDDRYGAGACCPAFPGDDPDGDGRCGAVDTCPEAFSPDGGAAYRVARVALSWPPYGRLLGLFSPDSLRIVFRTGPNSVAGEPAGDLYSVPTTGGPATLLHGRPGPEHGGVPRVGQTPDGSTIVFTADSQIAGRYELYTMPASGGAAQLISAPLQPNGDVSSFQVAQDGARVVYQADQDTDFVAELYSVAVGGGPVVKLNAPGHRITYPESYHLSPDGTTVVYVNDNPSNDLWAVPIAGGTPWKLVDPSVAGAFRISANGTHVLYRRNWDLYAVPIGGGTEQQLNGPLPVGGGVTSAFETTPDGSQVVYIADENIDGVYELYRVGIDGTGRTRLTPGLSLSTYPNFATLSIAPDGSRAVVRRTNFELYSVELAGESLDQLASFVDAFLVSPDSSTVVHSPLPYSSSDEITVIRSVPTAGGDSTTLALGTLPTDRFVLSAVSPDSATVLYYSSNPVTGGLWVAPLVADTDADGDGTTFPCDCDPADGAVHAGAQEINDGQDNQCPGDPGAGLIDELGQATVDASGTFTWPAQQGATMYEVARAETPDFSVGCATWQTSDPWWVDGDSPPAGGAYYYLYRSVAPNPGSWGSDSAGVERGPICP